MNDFREIVLVVPTDKIGAIYAAVAALMGASVAASAVAAASQPVRGSTAQENGSTTAPAPQGTATVASGDASGAAAQSAGNGAGDASGDAGDPNEVDAGGWPWSADMHAATKGKTKDGFWRMKVGVSRPDPKPGFPKDGGAPATTSTANDGAASTSSGSAPAAQTAQDDDDEFAAFRQASEKANAADAAAAQTVAARKWTDADLGALCNQAAVKLGDPTPVKALIQEYVGEGVAHSRNIPEDKREAFAKAVEAKAGITFAA